MEAEVGAEAGARVAADATKTTAEGAAGTAGAAPTAEGGDGERRLGPGAVAASRNQGSDGGWGRKR
eukprot:COSAG01_NODE_32355_length_582_cov_18.602484_1_plen_66_part_00